MKLRDGDSAGAGGNGKMTPYLVLLMTLLCTAAFLEGYDFFIISLIIDLLAKEYHITNQAVLFGMTVVNIGAIVGFFLIRLGDRIGRKPVFIIGVIGYGSLSILTAFSHSFYLYIALQFLTKIFLVTEFNIAIVMVAEEYPAKIRGTAVAVLEVAGALGGGAASILFKYMLPVHGWRGMYMLGGIPLLLVPVFILFVRETKHFSSINTGVAERLQKPLLHIWSTPSRKNVLLVGTLWFMTYLPYAGMIYIWVLFAKTERGWDAAKIGVPFLIATILGMTGYLVSGAMMDSIGRRKTGIIFFLGSAVSLVWTFQARGVYMTPALISAMFFNFALLPIVSTYNAELFPTDLRANAQAWCNFLMGRPAQVAAPFIVAGISHYVGGIGNAVCLFAIAPLIGAILVALYLPETKGKKIEELEEAEPQPVTA